MNADGLRKQAGMTCANVNAQVLTSILSPFLTGTTCPWLASGRRWTQSEHADALAEGAACPGADPRPSRCLACGPGLLSSKPPPLCRPGCLTVNIGDGLTRWTDGVFKSTYHRVRAPKAGDPTVSPPPSVVNMAALLGAHSRPACALCCVFHQFAGPTMFAAGPSLLDPLLRQPQAQLRDSRAQEALGAGRGSASSAGWRRLGARLPERQPVA